MRVFFIVLLMVGMFPFYSNSQICKKKKVKKLEQKGDNLENLQKYAKTKGKSINFYKKYGLKESYLPLPGQQENFEKTIHVSIHIWQREDGTGNFEDTPEKIERLKQVADWVSTFYSNNAENISPLPYKTIFIGEPLLRVELDGIYFYQDTTKDSSLHYCNNNYQHNVKLDKYLEKHHPERLNSLRLHLVRGRYAKAWGYSHDGSILTFVYANNVDMNETSEADYALSQHWAHEIAHGLDLWHTYDTQGAWMQNCRTNYIDFLWDVYDTTAVQPCRTQPICDVCLIPKSSKNNNIMGGGSGQFKSAMQIGIMRRSTVIKNEYNRNYNVRDFITGYSSQPMRITDDEVWDFSMKLYQDLIINPGVTLTIKDEVQFSPFTKVIIRPGGKLILDGGILRNENYYNRTWDGVVIRGEKKKNPKKRGVLEIINGGQVLNVR